MDDATMQMWLDNIENLSFEFVADLPAKDPASPESFQLVDERLEYDYECPMCHYRWSGQTRLGLDGSINDDLVT